MTGIELRSLPSGAPGLIFSEVALAGDWPSRRLLKVKDATLLAGEEGFGPQHVLIGSVRNLLQDHCRANRFHRIRSAGNVALSDLLRPRCVAASASADIRAEFGSRRSDTDRRGDSRPVA